MGKTEKRAGKPKAAKAETKKIAKPAPAAPAHAAVPSVAAPAKPATGVPVSAVIPSFAPPAKPKNPATEFVIKALNLVDHDTVFGAVRKNLGEAPGEAWWLGGDWDNCTVGAFIRYAQSRL